MTSKNVNKLQEIDSILDTSIGVSNAHTTTLTGGYVITNSGHISNGKTSDPYQPTFLTIGNLKLTQEEYETCMRHLLEITKQAKPEDFI